MILPVKFILNSYKLMDRYDQNQDGHIEFSDFVEYVLDQEAMLRINFHELDHNKDGFIDADEIMLAFRKLGVNIELAEATGLLKRMDTDDTLLINWNEWRDYLLLHPSSDITEIVHFWRHAMEPSLDVDDVLHPPSYHYHFDSIIDVGEDTLVPDDFTETELQTGVWWRHLVAGAAAGAVSRTCTAPLDRLKVFLQAHGTRENKLGIRSGLAHMLKEGGPRSLWRGNGVNILKIAPETAIKFAAYEQIKSLFKQLGGQHELGPLERFLSGSMAGAISQSIIYPLEVLKTRLALRKTGQYRGIADCAAKIYGAEGIRSFYRGYLPNLIGIIPYAGIDLCVYETLKRLYIQHRPGSDPGVAVLLACGTTSSTCGQLASYPLALVRTKLQAKITLSKNDTMVGLFKDILKREGPLGLYRGITPNFMKVIPAVSISYVVYEHSRKMLGIEMT